MTEINGTNYYTAIELCNQLELKYSSVISVIRKFKIKKINNRYYITEEELDKMKNRQRQSFKPDFLYC